MGVPKFYRWISERYPCLSEVVKEFQLPEFDNLYLDMNGIIHVCSHPNDDDPHFRITEEAIFKNICHYIDFLYRMIKPRKVFFMAVDGVAPRAKMNQQRGRRFRSAREAEENIKKAQEKGETLPTEQRFDSNCITPGTPFMVRLQNHLKYFVIDKITHDPLWQGRQIYLSGHETPGEGEHKVMDYIRYSKSQSDYDPDTRHCLYGLDADLIMLGLVSHEPRFSLLREEVRFGGHKDKNSKRPMTPEETTFHLLHLSLLRDYLAYEFSDIKGKLSFGWDMENIIDDWVLMGFLVGNDFIPHLPHLHIHHDALPMLWATYKKVLPTLDGYLNEGGKLNLYRFEKFMVELSKYDSETFESAFSDLSYLESKLGGKAINESAGEASRGKPSKAMPYMKKLKPFKVKQNGNAFAALEDMSSSGAMASSGVDSLDDEDSESDDDTVTSDDADDEEEEDLNTVEDEFRIHKRDYYMNKMAYSSVTPEVIKQQARGYVTAIQWVLLYYYEGCPSWSWFFEHHYAPYISDIRDFKDFKITFELSKPFLPFQQLMAVLPAASKELLPPGLQPLMTEASSPVLDFYPVDFSTDLNGKQQDWEAVVLIPFIEENRLLTAMSSREHLLTKEEQSRNCHGPHLMYQWSTEDQGFYPSSLPGVFPDIHLNKAMLTEIDKHMFHIDANKLRKGILDGCKLDVYFPGFPTLRFLPHTFGLSKTGVKVFQHCSRGDNMVLRLKTGESQSLEEVADELLGKETYVGWPHLHEAKVFAVADNSHKIEVVEDPSKKGKEVAISYNRRSLDGFESQAVVRDADSIKRRQMDRFAIDVGNTEIVVYAKEMTGRSYTFGLQGAITLSKQFASQESAYVYQMTVQNIDVEESAVTTFKTLDEVFPVDSPVFMVGNPHYGAQGKVKEVLPELARVRVVLDVTEELDLSHLARKAHQNDYLSNVVAAQQVGMDGHLMSRITGCMFVEKSTEDGGGGGGGGRKVNIGLNLKLTKKGEEVPGFTKKTEKGWSYSHKCVKQVAEYINTFPQLWRIIQTIRDEKDVFQESKLFPQGSSKTLADVRNYLDDLPCAKLPRMPFGSEILLDEKVAEIEKLTANLNPVPDIVKMKVKPRLLFRPLANQGSLVPDPEADFQLYDRVVVVKTGYSVPFGQRGTLIGVPSDNGTGLGPHSLYDVVFDKPFTGGINLRCSSNKGYRVPGSAMLNLTFGEFRKKVGTSVSGSSTMAGGSYGANSTHNNNTRGSRAPPHTNTGPLPSSRNAWQQQHQQPAFTKQSVQWDSRGQPLFGKIFKNDGGVRQGNALPTATVAPQFVTPKMSNAHTGITVRKGTAVTASSQERDNQRDNSEFDNMWKNLQSHQNIKQGGPPKPSGQTMSPDILKKLASTLPLQNPHQQRHQNSGSASLTTSSSVVKGGNMVLAHSPDNKASPRLLHHPIPQRPSQPTTPNNNLAETVHPLRNSDSTSSHPLQSSLLEGALGASGNTGDVNADIPPSVQNLFAKASQSQQQDVASGVSGPAAPGGPLGPEDAEFLAMFNSLKTQVEESLKPKPGNKSSSPDPASDISPVSIAASAKGRSPKSQAAALKQLLKIGMSESGPTSHVVSDPLSSLIMQNDSETSRALSSSAGASVQASNDSHDGTEKTSAESTQAYGRQVSLQELFQEANRQQQKQHQLATTVQLNVNQPPPALAGSKSPENRDPIAEMEVFCQRTFNNPDAQFDFKHQPKQNAYIAIVTLPNGQRYEGSMCKTRQDAAKSAAAMALLCLKSNIGGAPHPVIKSFMAGAGQKSGHSAQTINRFFSPNSAFSPIGGLPGPNPQQMLNVVRQAPPTQQSGPQTGVPILLTPQHFVNQPPPALPPNPLIHMRQQQQNQQMQHNLAHMVQHPPPPTSHYQKSPTPNQSVSYAVPGSDPQVIAALQSRLPASPSSSKEDSQTTSPNKSSSQQFIPMQVTKQQKKKDSTTDVHHTPDSSTSDVGVTQSPSSVSTQLNDSNTVVNEGVVRNSLVGRQIQQTTEIVGEKSGWAGWPMPPRELDIVTNLDLVSGSSKTSCVNSGDSLVVRPEVGTGTEQKTDTVSDSGITPGLATNATSVAAQSTTQELPGTMTSCSELPGTMTSCSDTSPKPAAKPAQKQKKKSRLAANFGQRS